MTTKKDYYEILGISKTADDKEIKSAFRNLAKKYHPDVNKEKDAESKFKEIQEAYAVLSDPSNRKKYDQFGHNAFSNGAGFNGAGFDFSDFDFSDIFGSSFGFNFGNSQRSSRAKRGRDSIIKMTLTFEEAVSGAKKVINIDVSQSCSECDGEGGHGEKTCHKCRGSGTITQEQRSLFGVYVTRTECPECDGKGKTFSKVCSKCRGNGQVKINQDINVTIPAGVDNGNQLRLQGKGEVGVNGGPNGDIYIEFVVKNHSLFKRDDSDIYLELPITIGDAALGVKKQIPTLYGNITLTIPEGSQTGDKHRLKGKGIEDVSTKRKGDMFIIIKVLVPNNLNKEQKILFEKLNNTNLDRSSAIKDFEKYLK